MYQMYAYQKKYGAKNVTLLYPQTEKLMPDSKIEFKSQDNVTVKVQFLDLFSIQDSITSIANELAEYQMQLL